MAEAIKFFLNVLVRQGVWIFGLAWLIAVGGWAIFVRRDGSRKSDEDQSDLLGKKALLGAAVLVAGIVLAL